MSRDYTASWIEVGGKIVEEDLTVLGNLLEEHVRSQDFKPYRSNRDLLDRDLQEALRSPSAPTFWDDESNTFPTLTEFCESIGLSYRSHQEESGYSVRYDGNISVDGFVDFDGTRLISIGQVHQHLNDSTLESWLEEQEILTMPIEPLRLINAVDQRTGAINAR